MSQKWQQAFDIEGLSPKEVIEKIAATICLLNYQAIEFAHNHNEGLKDEIVEQAYKDGWDAGYEKGHKDGMTEAVTTITE